jgi:hypothetical protein
MTGWNYGAYNDNGTINYEWVRKLGRTYAYAIAGYAESMWFDDSTNAFEIMYLFTKKVLDITVGCYRVDIECPIRSRSISSPLDLMKLTLELRYQSKLHSANRDLLQPTAKLCQWLHSHHLA